MQGITTLFEERSLLLIVLNNLSKNHKSCKSNVLPRKHVLCYLDYLQ